MKFTLQNEFYKVSKKFQKHSFSIQPHDSNLQNYKLFPTIPVNAKGAAQAASFCTQTIYFTSSKMVKPSALPIGDILEQNLLLFFVHQAEKIAGLGVIFSVILAEIPAIPSDLTFLDRARPRSCVPR